MNLAEFSALCDREWKKQDRGGRGDVVMLTLTDPSAVELMNDVLTDRTGSFIPWPLILTKEDVAEIRAGAGLREVVNPITRTPVKIRTKPDGKRESARVRVVGGTYRQTWWPAAST